MFAVAAFELHKPSETFVRDHIRLVAPGNTVLLVRTPEPDTLGLPALTGFGERPVPANRIVARVTRSVRAQRARFFGPAVRLPRAERRRVADFLRAHGVTKILAEYLTIAVPLIEPAADAGVRLYAHAHGFDATLIPQESAHWRAHYLRLFEAAAGVFTPSRFIAGRLEALGCPAGKLAVSPCGIDPGRFSRTTAEPLRALAVGRLVPKKAPHLTIAAFAKATRTMPGARLDVVGDGDLMALCRATAAEHGASEKVHLHGWQSHAVVQELMGRTSVFLQHSVTAASGDTEGLPVAVLEAMASTVPVVATRHSGIPEAVVHGETGLLVDEHDVGGMADALATLLADPARARAMGEAGRRRVLADFTLERTRTVLRRTMALDP